MALQELWPEVPHQVCQFHALHDAAKPAFEADKQVKTAMRKALQPKIRVVRKQLKRDIPQAEADKAEQLTVLDTYGSQFLSYMCSSLTIISLTAQVKREVSRREGVSNTSRW